jgi:hypothetical protein
MLSSPETDALSAPSSFKERGPCGRLVSGLEADRPAGVGEHVQTGIGVPQKLGRSCRLHEELPEGDTGLTNPRPDAAPRSGGGSETCVLPWYRQTKETKCGGKDDRKSQCLDSTDETGEQTPVRTPRREARHRDHGLVVGTYAGYLEIR